VDIPVIGTIRAFVEVERGNFHFRVGGYQVPAPAPASSPNYRPAPVLTYRLRGAWTLVIETVTRGVRDRDISLKRRDLGRTSSARTI